VGRIGELGLVTAGRLVRMPPVPDLPEGRVIDLPGRGTTYVVDTGPMPSARGGDTPTVFLLHALACTGLLTWYPCLNALRRRYRLVIFDQRGHGQGIRTSRFDLDDCADDVTAVADELGVETFVAAGYSMGSLVAQNTWLRHPDRVDGLVLGASTTHFATTPRRQRTVTNVGARLAAVVTAQRRLAVEAFDQSVDDRWAWRQFRATTAADVAAAGAVIARFDSRAWIGDVDVPSAVVVTARDRLIPPTRQRELARHLPGAAVYEVDAGHGACVLSAQRFRPAMLAATASVTSRIRSNATNSEPR
jgi:3-oxoadipate enol-lactonase